MTMQTRSESTAIACLRNCSPPISGIFKSIKAKSNDFWRNSVRLTFPLEATSTSYPLSRRIVRQLSRIESSSSTTRIRELISNNLLWKNHHACGTAAWTILGPDLAAMIPDNAVTNRKAETRSPSGSLCRKEGIEYAGDLLRRNPAPVVAHLDSNATLKLRI